jgi:hypothetical protein
VPLILAPARRHFISRRGLGGTLRKGSKSEPLRYSATSARNPQDEELKSKNSNGLGRCLSRVFHETASVDDVCAVAVGIVCVDEVHHVRVGRRTGQRAARESARVEDAEDIDCRVGALFSNADAAGAILTRARVARDIKVDLIVGAACVTRIHADAIGRKAADVIGRTDVIVGDLEPRNARCAPAHEQDSVSVSAADCVVRNGQRQVRCPRVTGTRHTIAAGDTIAAAAGLAGRDDVVVHRPSHRRKAVVADEDRGSDAAAAKRARRGATKCCRPAVAGNYEIRLGPRSAVSAGV